MKQNSPKRTASWLLALAVLLGAVFGSVWLQAAAEPPEETPEESAAASSTPRQEEPEPGDEGSGESPLPGEVPEEQSETAEEPGEEEAPTEEEILEEMEAEALEEEAAEDDMYLEDGSLMLDDMSVEVYTFEQLKNAISQDNGFTNIYLGADITTTGGIEVSSAKASICIEGQNRTLTQHHSESITEIIYIRAANTTTKSATLRNCNVVGSNFYGIITAFNETATAGITITYDNITYTGPQPLYHRYGAAHIKNSTFTIQYTDGTAANEFCEVNRLSFEGDVTINAIGTTNSVLWLTNANTSVNVLSGANVTVYTNDYFLYNDSGSSNLDFIVGSGARLVVNAPNGFLYAAQTMRSLTVEDSGYLEINHTNSGSDFRIRLTSSLAVGNGASLLYTRATTALSAAFLFTNPGGSATFTNPALVKIYNAAGVPMNFTGAGSLRIEAGAVNQWASVGSATPTTPPDHIWNKSAGALTEITGSYTGATQNSLSSNVTPMTDPVETSPNEYFTFNGTQLLMFGALDLTIDPVTTGSAAVQGGVSGAASLTARYTSGGEAATATGSGEGRYSIPLNGALADVDTELMVTAVVNGLYKNEVTIVLDGGLFRLSFLEIPATISFMAGGIPEQPQIIGRDDADWHLTVRDTRLTPATWAVQASIAQPLTGTLNGETYTLPGALVFVDSTGSPVPLTGEDLTVFTQTAPETGDTRVGWAAERGILLYINPLDVVAEVNYTTTIDWTLVDAP